MPANHSSPTIHYWAGKHPGRFGWLVGPTARTKTKLRPWMPYALDNDAFSAWTKKAPWDYDNWRSLLEWARDSGQAPLWVLVPDVVADADKTIESWWRYSKEARSFGWHLAFAVQDGMTPCDVPQDADVVFVGGTTDWKWKTAKTWAKKFQRVHIGRVNELHRLWECEALGIESVDGTGWFRDGQNGRRIIALEKWLSVPSRPVQTPLTFTPQAGKSPLAPP